MARPCHKLHPPSPGSCHLCRLVRDRADYRELWAADGPPGAKAAPRVCGVCGQAVRLVPCGPCGARTKLKVCGCERES